MSLSCSCDSDDDFDFYWEFPEDYSVLETKKARRCLSCKQPIKVGSTVLKFDLYHRPHDDIQERIYGEGGEVYMSPKYLCETCGDLFFSLQDLGFSCVMPDENMHELVHEYHKVYGAQPQQNTG